MQYHYIIKEDSQVYRRAVPPDEKLNVNGPVMEQLMHDAMTEINSLFPLEGYGTVGLVKHRGYLYWRLYPERLVIDAPFMVHQGYTVPVFKAPGGSTHMRLTWTPPEGMYLRMLVVTHQNYEVQKPWLFAMDKSGKTFRLPIANLFEDCGVCLGLWYGIGNNALDALKRTITQYETAPYNADLAYYENETIKMFRWKPKGEGFDVIPPEGDWTKLCQLVSVATSQYVIKP